MYINDTLREYINHGLRDDSSVSNKNGSVRIYFFEFFYEFTWCVRNDKFNVVFFRNLLNF